MAKPQAGKLPVGNAQAATVLVSWYQQERGKLLFPWGQLSMVIGETILAHEVGHTGSDKCHEQGCCCTSAGWETPEGSTELAENLQGSFQKHPCRKGDLDGFLSRP